MNNNLHFIYRSLFLLGIFLCSCVSVKSAQSPSDFKVRAFYLDCRTQVMTVSAIKNFASDLSTKGINTLLIEYEATFPSRNMLPYVIIWHLAAMRLKTLSNIALRWE